MRKRLFALATFIAGILLGVGAHWLYTTDACYDAGGYWEPHGSYCYGARVAHPGAEWAHP